MNPRPKTIEGPTAPDGSNTRHQGNIRDLTPKAGPGGRAPLSPSWFAAVMGTGIVANAAVSLPSGFAGLLDAATVIWAAAALLLLALLFVYVRQRSLSAHAADPVLSQFLGAVPMALLTVGAGTLLLGERVVGTDVAVGVAWTLWSAGTLLGLGTSCAVPYLMITRHRFGSDAAFGGWLLPVVPPMVAASAGALLIPRVPAGELRLAMMLCCCAMLGLGFLAALLVLAMVYSRLVHSDAPIGAVVPTVWIGAGALGQTVTALGALSTVAPTALPASYAHGTAAAALLGGVGVWGFASLWLVLATALTLRELRRGMPFAPTWWSFIFPLGACVTGAGSLASLTDSLMFTCCAIGLYMILVLAWVIVLGHSFRQVSPSTRRRAAGNREAD
ncbi:TDT family transporter [Streptomyces sp. NPDC048594]|uniref:TDT family transporter n=1 Tax=Streptomyces sp. NPDC048594 TaxID=3365575 RepID=UPI00371AAF25